MANKTRYINGITVVLSILNMDISNALIYDYLGKRNLLVLVIILLVLFSALLLNSLIQDIWR